MPNANPITSTALRPSALAVGIAACLQAKQPVCIWGEPGIGKSNLVHQVATANNRLVRDVRAVLLDPVDLRGLPHVNGDNRAHWATPDFLPRDGAGVLFLDELNRAPMLVQNACLQLALDRRIGEYVLPQGWDVIAACNRESDGGGVTRMNSALSSRFIHYDFDVSLEDWCKWAITHDIEPMVIAFVRFRPELLHQFDRTSRSFPCPRSWEFVSRIAKTGMQNADVEHATYVGAVGLGAAVEFSAFTRLYRNIPSIDGILLNPTTANVPTNEPASLYAIGAALARRATVQNFARVLQYLDRMPQEYTVMAVKDAVGRDASLTAMSEFTKWSINHSDVCF